MALTQISTGGVKDDAVTAGKIPANAIGSSEIADDAVGAAQIADDAVGSAAIADDGVVQAAIADEAIDEARLQISNAGTNGQFLQKQSGNTGGLTWATASSTPTVITVADESSDTSCNIAFFTAATGDLAPKTGDNLTFNSSTGELEADIIKDSKGDVRSIPAVSASNPYTLVASDAGKAVSTNGFTITIPNNVFSTGDAVTLVNNSSSDTTLTRAIGALYLGSDGTNSASLTLKARTTATIYFTAGTVGYISGGGLS